MYADKGMISVVMVILVNTWRVAWGKQSCASLGNHQYKPDDVSLKAQREFYKVTSHVGISWLDKNVAFLKVASDKLFSNYMVN
jgi:hypothetical protein